jgi:porphobilinogen synthase
MARSAMRSARGLLKGDKKTYQMDPANAEEALREVAARSGRGRRQRDGQARPALSRHRRRVKERFEVPVFAYQVSGEYAMIEAAVAAGAGDRDALVLETLLAFKRAGCSGVLTYHAAHARGWVSIAARSCAISIPTIPPLTTRLPSIGLAVKNG